MMEIKAGVGAVWRTLRSGVRGGREEDETGGSLIPPEHYPRMGARQGRDWAGRGRGALQRGSKREGKLERGLDEGRGWQMDLGRKNRGVALSSSQERVGGCQRRGEAFMGWLFRESFSLGKCQPCYLPTCF